MRQINLNYSDPLSIVWTHLANQLGFEVVRDPEVFASFDGDKVLRFGTPDTLDPDDSLGQMVLHELCHALVEGPDSFRTPDWGLDFDEPSHRAHEFATLRLQASFADQAGFRNFFASTTDFRWYFDLIPNDALQAEMDHQAIFKICCASADDAKQTVADVSKQKNTEPFDVESIVDDDRRAIELAQKGWRTANQKRWSEPIRLAVDRTVAIANIILDLAPERSIWRS